MFAETLERLDSVPVRRAPDNLVMQKLAGIIDQMPHRAGCGCQRRAEDLKAWLLGQPLPSRQRVVDLTAQPAVEERE